MDHYKLRSLSAAGTNPSSDGVMLSGGGAVSNAAGGTVSGYNAGVSIAGSGSVVNDGAIASTNQAGSGYVYGNGVFVATTAGVILGGGGVSNAASGVITGYLEGVAVGGGGRRRTPGAFRIQPATRLRCRAGGRWQRHQCAGRNDRCRSQRDPDVP